MNRFHSLTIQEIELLSAFRGISDIAREHVVQEVKKLLRPLPERCREYLQSGRADTLPAEQYQAVVENAF